MRFWFVALLATSILIPATGQAFEPRIEEWNATWASGPTTRSDDFEDGFVPGDASDTGDSEPGTGGGCQVPEPGDEAGGSLGFRRPGGAPACVTPDGRPTQVIFFFPAAGAPSARAVWSFIVPGARDAFVLQFQNTDAASGGPDPQRANLIVRQTAGDLVLALNDEALVEIEGANLGPASSYQGESGTIELDLVLTQSGADLLPHGRYRLCLPSCGDLISDPFVDLVDVSANPGELNAADLHMATSVAVTGPVQTPTAAPWVLLLLAALLAAIGAALVGIGRARSA